METSMSLPQKIKMDLPQDPTIPPLDVYRKGTESRVSKKYLYTYFHSSIITLAKR